MGVSVVLNPWFLSLALFGLVLSDTYRALSGFPASGFFCSSNAIKYGCLVALIFIRYKSIENKLQVESDGFILRVETSGSRGIFNAGGSAPKVGESGAPSRGVEKTLPKSVWPPGEALGWTPFKSLPLNQAKGKGAQHFWTKGDSSVFHVRSVGYKQSKEKQASAAPLYECIGVDLVRADKLISGVSTACKVFSRILTGEEAGDIPFPWLRYKESKWSAALGIPRLLVINTQLPYSSPSLWAPQSADSDPGFSIVSYYAISPTTVAEGPAVNLLKRLIKEGKSSKEDTALKTIGIVENMDEVGFPDLVAGYNGKPVLVTKSAKLSFLPSQDNCELLEIDFDVRQWSILARKSLHSLRDKLKDAKCQIGMLIEGRTDEELPEQLLGCFGLQFLDIHQALRVDDDF